MYLYINLASCSSYSPKTLFVLLLSRVLRRRCFLTHKLLLSTVLGKKRFVALLSSPLLSSPPA